MRIPSGSTDRYLYFKAVDVTDLKTPETSLSGFTVYHSKNGAAEAAYTSPTVNEIDATNMPGVYALLLDENPSITSGMDTEEVAVQIAHASMAPVTRTYELYRPKFTEGQSATMANNMVDADLERIQGDAQSATDLKDFADAGYDPSTNKVQGVVLVDTLTTYTGNTPQTGDSFARIGANGGSLSAIPWNPAWDAEVQSEATDALNAYDPPTRAEATADKDEILTDTNDIQTRLPAALVAGRMASNAEVVGDKTGYRLSATGVDDIWDEAIAGHLGAGSVGEALDNAGAAGDPWATALPGAYGAGTAGQIIGDFINAPLDAIDGIVDAIKLKTDNLPASPAAVGSAMTLTAGERNSIADAYLDRADAIETGLTPRQAIRGIAAIGVGDVTGGPTTPVFKGAGVGTTRVSSTADADGNRTVVLNLS